MPLYSYNRKHKPRARDLRQRSTDAEQLLWSKLRSRQLLGLKFRRQHPIDNFIIDFYCEEKNLAIELDGGQHSNERQKTYDTKRTILLNSLGISVLRFWDNEILKNIDGVLEVIRMRLIA